MTDLEPLVDALEVEDMLTRQFTYTLSVNELRHADDARRLSHRPIIAGPAHTRLFHRRRAVV